jgi:3' exoribonuclease family, domain 1
MPFDVLRTLCFSQQYKYHHYSLCYLAFAAVETILFSGKMPLDTASTYGQTLLRTDGRRWNELRRISASISTQSSSDGSSQFIIGNTVVVCTIIGPKEGCVDEAQLQEEKD